MSDTAFIQKQMLVWARTRAGLDTAGAAKGVTTREKWEAWEAGDAHPTFRQALELARRLHVPLGYLFLTDPPDERLPLPDLRTKQSAGAKPSPAFLDVIYDALRKQEWYHDYLQEQDADPVSFVGRFADDTPVATVAEDIVRTLRLGQSLRKQAGTIDDYFRLLVERIEAAGVLVLRSSIVGNNTHRPLDSEEFQGFAQSDNLAPLVFVNQNDYLSAQVFTLFHELAHIWTGLSGVSDLDYLDRPESQSVIHQRRADQIAAEALVPARDFEARWAIYPREDRLDYLRKDYRVSIFVILRRAYDLEKLSFVEYRSKYDEYKRQIKPNKPPGGGGYASLFSRNSKKVATAVLHSVVEGRLAPTEGAILLNVRPPSLYGMEQHMVMTGA
jgi:Zn-dependent peptidase ImmA (M78 family)